MTPFLSVLLFCAVTAGPPKIKPGKPVPTTARRPVIDGKLKDFAPALDVPSAKPAFDASARVALKLTFQGGVLFLAATVKDDVVLAEDVLEVTVHFPEAGALAQGFSYRFGPGGAAPSTDERTLPSFAASLVRAKALKGDGGFTVEAGIPGRALPRFPATGPLNATVCADYLDVDEEDAEPSRLSTCESGEPKGGPLKLPDELRKPLKTPLPADVEGVEGAEGGWLGYGELAAPAWIQGDEPLSPDSVRRLATAGRFIEPKQVSLPIPDTLELEELVLVPVLFGSNPFAQEKCAAKNELRVSVYALGGNVARRVLEWPVSSCALGRAMRFEVTEHGGLIVGYTNGSTAHFTWSTDHFERSELGALTR